MKTARLVHHLGTAWLYLAGAVIIFGYATTLWFSGFAAFGELISPFNVFNFVAVVITLAPGLLLHQLANFLARRQTKQLLP